MKKKSNLVFYISLFITIAIVAWGLIAKDNFSTVVNMVKNFLTVNFGWSYLMSMLFFVGFALILAFSKYGKIKLGADDSKPEYSTASWFAMLFGAGMGIGLVFWGVAEPISHFVSPPEGMVAGSAAAANFAMKTSFVHWGFHPWANYSILGLALAYFQFRKNKPGLVSSIFIPLIGEERVNGPIGKLIDVLAIFATVSGVATSLGMGTLQINSGLEYVFGIPNNKMTWLIIIAIVTVIYIWTAVSGVEKGIKFISDINLYVAFGLLAAVILIGPTLKMINIFTNGFGQYVGTFIQESLHIEAFGDNGFTNGWRIFYWAWWIAWAPFVGTFIARISKGRTIKEFVMGVIIAPSIASFIWFAAFGTLGMNLIEKLGVPGLQAMAANPSTALFAVLSYYPLGKIISFVAVFLLCTFFITSANSATFVLGMLSSNGDLNPSNSRKILWGLVQAGLATALLLSGTNPTEGLTALQTASVAAAFPFIFVMIFGSVSFVKALRTEKL